MPDKKNFRLQRSVPLPGSERAPLDSQQVNRIQQHVAGPVDNTEQDAKIVHVSVIVRRKEEINMQKWSQPGAQHLTHEEFAEKHGADPDSVELVKQFAEEYGLKVDSLPSGEHRAIHLSGTQKQMDEAFGVKLSERTIDGGTYRVREGTICIPEELVGHITAVLGLDNRPQAKPHSRRAKRLAVGNGSFDPQQVGKLYGFPAGATAKGQTIGIVELGGGFRPEDITAYFQGMNLPVPDVTAVSVDKAKNKPGKASGADGEVMLDIEVCAAVAPGAKIVVYFAPNTDQGFTDAIGTAVHDTANNPSVISISWGGPEPNWTQQAMTVLDQACQSAAALGVTITVACGDDGSTDGLTDGSNHVDFPASSPHVLACGGTKLVANGSGSTIQSETVWNELSNQEGATGGGVSSFFPLPSWQADAHVPKGTNGGGRGVPDVAGDADPTTGYNVRVDGQKMTIGGTSAVAPLWAGLIALANAANKRKSGFVNPLLYDKPAAFHDITTGNNGGFKATQGWDPCTGMGSPKGAQVIAALAITSRAASGLEATSTAPVVVV